MKKMLLVFLLGCGDNIHPDHFDYDDTTEPDAGSRDIRDTDGVDNGSDVPPQECTDTDIAAGVCNPDAGVKDSHPLTPACIVGLLMSGEVPHECYTPPGQLP